jgi:HSP20 family protein
MSEAVTKLPVKKGGHGGMPLPAWQPFKSLQQQIDRLFEDFGRDAWPRFPRSFMEPMWGKEDGWGAVPAVDVVEKDKAYEITAELPGLSDRDIEVTLANGTVTIKGEKKEEKEEEKQGYHLSERRYGSFARSFRVPEGADASKIEAVFKNGVLTLTLPKTAEAQKPEKKVAIKAA